MNKPDQMNEDNRIVDAHCHISLEPLDLNPEKDNLKHIIGEVISTSVGGDKDLILNIMSTTHFDHELLFKSNALEKTGGSYKLGLGIHPWYSYLYTFDKGISKLDHYLSVITVDNKEVAEKLNIEVSEINKIETYVKTVVEENIHILPDVHYINDIFTDEVFKQYNFIGEVGLDFIATATKVAHITGFKDVKVNKNHQTRIFEFFLQKYIQNRSNMKFISVHSVKAPQATFEAIKSLDKSIQGKNQKANIVLHSYTGTIDQFEQQYLKLKNINSFISLSTFINCRDPLTKKQKKLISQLDVKNMLIETDVPINTSRENFNFIDNLKNTLNVIHKLKNTTLTIDELRTEINNNYDRLTT